MTTTITPQIEFTWKANPGKQETFLSAPDTILEVFYGGAAFGGKSEALVMLPIVRRFYEEPTFHGLILRRTFRQLEGSLILKAHDYYPLFGGKYNEQKKRYTFPSGAIIDFGHAEHEHDITSYDTAEYQYIAFDELTHFTEYQYLYMVSRCRTRSPRIPRLMRSASNPGNIGHGWVRKRFVEPAREGMKVLVDSDNNKRMFIPAFISDNPVGLKLNPNYPQQLELLPEAEKRAKLYGDWWTFSGQVFSEWREHKMPDEPDNAIHVIKPFEIPTWWPQLLAIDWGYSAMLCAGRYAMVPNSPRVVKFQEYTSKKENISVWAANITRLCESRRPDFVVIDKSANQHRGEPRTIAEQFRDIFGMTPLLSDSDRVGGKMLMHEYLRWTLRPYSYSPKDARPDPDTVEYIYRARGLEAQRNYLKSFENPQHEDLTMLPKLQIFETCPETIKAIPLCVYDEKNVEDVAEFDGDDPYDETRYALKQIRRLKDTKEDVTLLKSAQASEQLNKSGDMTSYYLKMRNLDRQRNLPFGVRIRRRHRVLV